ncbi:hypothetical protein BG005_010040, partial [Podila minutissima]
PGTNTSEYDMAPQQIIHGIEVQIRPFAQGASTHQQHQQHHRWSIQIASRGFTIPQMQDDDEELEFEPVSSSVAKSK